MAGPAEIPEHCTCGTELIVRHGGVTWCSTCDGTDHDPATCRVCAKAAS